MGCRSTTCMIEDIGKSDTTIDPKTLESTQISHIDSEKNSRPGIDTIIFYDWDDTLFPTTWFTSCQSLSKPLQLSDTSFIC
jgi:hypothetical protein